MHHDTQLGLTCTLAPLWQDPTSVKGTMLQHVPLAQDILNRNGDCATRTLRDCEEPRRAKGVLGLYINLLTLEDDRSCGPLIKQIINISILKLFGARFPGHQGQV